MKGKPFLIAVFGLLCGCAGKFDSKVDFNVAEPLRVAVLPFAQVSSKGELVQTDENLAIDDVALLSEKLQESPARFVQEAVQSDLGQSSLDVITPAVVEAELLHNGFDIPGSQPVRPDLPKVFAASAQEICERLLSCDAVLYGKVTRWDRSYYGLQTVNTVGIELRLVSAKDGKVIYSSTAEDSESRGLTKGPTGFSNLVIEPIKGLDQEIIIDLARRTVTEMVKPLLASSRPEYLKSSPPAILATAHDAHSGAVSRTGKLLVIALGTPHQVASFSIGNSIDSVPMIERSSGHYIGEYIPLATDRFRNETVAVALRDQYGRTTTQKLGKRPVSLQ